MSTLVLMNPARFHHLVMAPLDSLLAHHARHLRAAGGSFAWITLSISSNVIGTSDSVLELRYSSSGAYLDIDHLIQV